jgi:ankyrin repeat protein
MDWDGYLQAHASARVAELLEHMETDALMMQDNSGRTVMHAALDLRCPLASVIAGCGKQVQDIAGLLDEDGFAPMHVAAQLGLVEALEVMMQAGIDVNVSSAINATPLMVAVSNERLAATELLLNCEDTIIDAADDDGCTALGRSAEAGHFDVGALLVNAGAHVNLGDASGMTPLHHAAAGGHASIVVLLLSNGAAVMAENTDKETPLHLAVQHGELESCAALCEAGAACDVLDTLGRSPMDLAVAAGNPTLIQMLKDATASLA